MLKNALRVLMNYVSLVRVCESCEDTTPRGYVKNLEKNIGDLLKNKITKNQHLNNIYEKSKSKPVQALGD